MPGFEEGALDAAEATLIGAVTDHDGAVARQAEDKAEARVALMAARVAAVYRDEGVAAQWERLETLRAEAAGSASDADEAEAACAAKEEELRTLHAGLGDQTRAAEQINELLQAGFGVRSLRLHSVGEEAGVRFEIRRGGERAYHLSEGERSLIAFCYFLVRLEEAGGDGEDLVVFVDDPMSSLDANHVYFIFSLLDARLAGQMGDRASEALNYRVKQLFVSTHSLDLLRYLIRLQGSTKKRRANFLIERTSAGSSLRPMPAHLANYATEFVYLFEQIGLCCGSEEDAACEHLFLHFGNNLRKFLEALLYFKYPHVSGTEMSDHNRRINDFFGAGTWETAWITRITNDLSHGGARHEQMMAPLDKPEISEVALFVLRALRGNDPTQYSHLILAAGLSDPCAADPQDA